MKSNVKSRCFILILLPCALLLIKGCERRENPTNAGDNDGRYETFACNIRHTLNRLPNLLKCSRRWEAGLIVISNVTENIRRIDDPLTRRHYVSDYTNAVANLEFPIDAAIDDNNASRLVEINLSAYSELIECGFSMLCEFDSMKPESWDFLLKASSKYKRALSMRANRLKARGLPDARFRADALFNDLRDGIQNCSCIIERGWYPSAKRRMSPPQLAEVRMKIKDVLGILPLEIENDAVK